MQKLGFNPCPWESQSHQQSDWSWVSHRLSCTAGTRLLCGGSCSGCLNFLPPVFSVRFFQSDDKRGLPCLWSMVTGLWGSCSVVQQLGGSDKLPEKGLEQELQKGGLSWLSMFWKVRKKEL